MPKWTKPSEGMPDVEAGDRIAIIVRERRRADGPLVSRLVMLEATEDGWEAIDENYAGYGPEDGELWSLESDICRIAEICT